MIYFSYISVSECCLNFLCFSWKSRCLWGICYGDIKIHSYEKENYSSSSTKGEHGLIITSSSEDENVQEKLKEDFRLCYAAGVGYKTLCVLDHTVDAYLLSKGSTYHWDICAPHAILLAMGGGIVACKTALKNPTDDIKQLQVRTFFSLQDLCFRLSIAFCFVILVIILLFKEYVLKTIKRNSNNKLICNLHQR